MTAPTPTDSGGRYWAVFSPEGEQYSGWRDFEFTLAKCDVEAGWHIREAVMLPASTYTRLLAIEAAARNAMDNSEVPDKWEYSEDSAHYAGGTWLDPKDAKELREAVGE